jgi:large subunit ribosomal protein L11
MAKETVSLMVKGGAATAGPPLGPALAGKGINIGTVVAQINEKTKEMKGMDVPVKVIADLDKKTFEIDVGLPPSSALLLKEAAAEKGSGAAGKKLVSALKVQHLIKVAKIKSSSIAGNTLKEKVKELAGTCKSLGILIEGKDARDLVKELDEGKYDALLKKEVTELTADENAELQQMRNKVREELAKVEAAEKAAAEAAAATATTATAPAGAAATTTTVAAKPEKK